MSTREQGGERKMELFQETTIGGVSIANRFVYSATWDGLAADDGSCTAKYRHPGGAGTRRGRPAHCRDGFCHPGRAVQWQLAAYDDRFVPGLTEMANAIARSSHELC